MLLEVFQNMSPWKLSSVSQTISCFMIEESYANEHRSTLLNLHVFEATSGFRDGCCRFNLSNSSLGYKSLKVYRALPLLKQHVSRFKWVFKMFKHGYGKIMLTRCFIRKYTSTSAKWESNLQHMERQSIALRIYNVAVDFTTVVVNVIVESIAISIYQDIWPADREQLFYSVF